MNRRLISVARILWLFTFIPLAYGLGGAPVQPTQAQPAKRSSSAIALTADGATLLAVNPDSNTLTLVDTAKRAAVAEIVVGVDPRTVALDDTGQRAYVANRGSNSITVVDLTSQTSVTEIAVGNRPYGVVVSPDGTRLYVAEQGANQVSILDTRSLAFLARITTLDRPGGLALSADGVTLYVTHLLTPTITVMTVRSDSGPAASLAQSNSASGRSGTRLFSTGLQVSTASLQLWPDSNLVQAIVLSPDGSRAYVPHTRSNTSNRALTFDTTVFPLVSLIDATTQQHLVGQQLDLGTLDPPGVGLPFDADVTRDGKQLWVVNAASNNISVIDLIGRRLTADIPVQDNPRGIILAPDGNTAYVNNTLAGTVSVVDVSRYAVTATIPVTRIPLPPVLLRGKRLFHSSARSDMARARWISCNTCHFEGEQDGRTWVFGFSGPRNTTSLLGMIETYPLRWSGEWNESADCEFAIRKENFGTGLISGEMNCDLSPPDCVNKSPNQGRSYDLDSLALFMDSLRVPRSPAHAHGEPLSEAEQRGQAIFNRPELGCITCHAPPLYTDQKKHDVGTATSDERIGPAYDTPALRGLYNSAPYFHDGSAATLRDTLTRPSAGREHDLRSRLTEQEISDLIAFLLALPFE